MMMSMIGKFIAAAALTSILAAPSACQTKRERVRDWIAERRASPAADGQRAWAGRDTQPLAMPSGAHVERNLAYGPDPLQRMDVYIPANAHNAPVIFMVHGGGWRRGEKDRAGVINNKVEYWLPKGYIVISIGYRLVPEVTPLVEADDVAKALAFAQDKAKSWGGDPGRFVLMGHSAGAHLVSLISADPSIASRAGAGPWLGTVALDSAAFNVVKIMEQQHFSLYDKAFGNNRELWQAASPTLRLTSAPVPMLLVCSSRREVACEQADGFADKARALGGRVEVAPIDLRHGEINAQLGTPGPLTAAVDAFLHSLNLP